SMQRLFALVFAVLFSVAAASLAIEGGDSSGGSPVSAAPSSSAPSKYKVWIWQENGDCLWRIAEKVYGDRDKWRLIYLANKDVIKHATKIYPRQVLKIPPPD